MAKKRLTLDKNKRVKAIARTRVGIVPPARALSIKVLRDKPKHKQSLDEAAE
jgi:hypothetical protein